MYDNIEVVPPPVPCPPPGQYCGTSAQLCCGPTQGCVGGNQCLPCNGSTVLCSCQNGVCPAGQICNGQNQCVLPSLYKCTNADKYVNMNPKFASKIELNGSPTVVTHHMLGSTYTSPLDTSRFPLLYGAENCSVFCNGSSDSSSGRYPDDTLLAFTTHCASLLNPNTYATYYNKSTDTDGVRLADFLNWMNGGDFSAFVANNAPLQAAIVKIEIDQIDNIAPSNGSCCCLNPTKCVPPQSACSPNNTGFYAQFKFHWDIGTLMHPVALKIFGSMIPSQPKAQAEFVLVQTALWNRFAEFINVNLSPGATVPAYETCIGPGNNFIGPVSAVQPQCNIQLGTFIRPYSATNSAGCPPGGTWDPTTQLCKMPGVTCSTDTDCPFLGQTCSKNICTPPTVACSIMNTNELGYAFQNATVGPANNQQPLFFNSPTNNQKIGGPTANYGTVAAAWTQGQTAAGPQTQYAADSVCQNASLDPMYQTVQQMLGYQAASSEQGCWYPPCLASAYEGGMFVPLSVYQSGGCPSTCVNMIENWGTIINSDITQLLPGGCGNSLAVANCSNELVPGSCGKQAPLAEGMYCQTQPNPCNFATSCPNGTCPTTGNWVCDPKGDCVDGSSCACDATSTCDPTKNPNCCPSTGPQCNGVSCGWPIKSGCVPGVVSVQLSQGGNSCYSCQPGQPACTSENDKDCCNECAEFTTCGPNNVCSTPTPQCINCQSDNDCEKYCPGTPMCDLAHHKCIAVVNPIYKYVILAVVALVVLIGLIWSLSSRNNTQ